MIEVVVSSGGINKLEAYKRLQIPEVWFWMNDELLRCQNLKKLANLSFVGVPDQVRQS